MEGDVTRSLVRSVCTRPWRRRGCSAVREAATPLEQGLAAGLGRGGSRPTPSSHAEALGAAVGREY